MVIYMHLGPLGLKMYFSLQQAASDIIIQLQQADLSQQSFT